MPGVGFGHHCCERLHQSQAVKRRRWHSLSARSALTALSGAALTSQLALGIAAFATSVALSTDEYASCTYHVSSSGMKAILATFLPGKLCFAPAPDSTCSSSGGFSTDDTPGSTTVGSFCLPYEGVTRSVLAERAPGVEFILSAAARQLVGADTRTPVLLAAVSSACAGVVVFCVFGLRVASRWQRAGPALGVVFGRVGLLAGFGLIGSGVACMNAVNTNRKIVAGVCIARS